MSYVSQELTKRSRMVAGSGIEPLTSGLWVPRSNQLSYPAIHFVLIYNTFYFLCNQEFVISYLNYWFNLLKNCSLNWYVNGYSFPIGWYLVLITILFSLPIFIFQVSFISPENNLKEPNFVNLHPSSKIIFPSLYLL